MIPSVADASPAPGCATADDCVVRMTGNRCCPQIAQAMTKTAAEANPLPTGPCECAGTPCAFVPVPNAECSDGGICVTAN